MRKCFLCLIIILICGFAMQCPVYSEENVTAKKILQKITVDGELDEVDWERAIFHTGFKVAGGELVEKDKNTEFSILYSEEGLYFGFICHEPNISALKTLSTQRSDDIKVSIDDCVYVFRPFGTLCPET
jgi:hypothetical protein